MKRTFLFLFTLISLSCFSQKKKYDDGPHKLYHKNGQLKLEGFYRNNKKVSIWKEYYDDGQLSKTYTFNNNGERSNNEESYYRNGNLNTKVTPAKNGVRVVRKYHKSTKALIHELFMGQVKKKTDDQKMFFKGYYENGNVKNEVYLVNGQIQGLWLQYYPSGEKEWEVNYVNDYKLGNYKQFYKNGNLKLEGEHLGNLKNGKEKRYGEDGKLSWEGLYLKDLLNGAWIHYQDNEKPTTYNFKEGRLKSKRNISLTPTKVPYWAFEEVPVYPGCEKVLGNLGKRKCMSKKIAEFVNKNFNTTIAKNLGLEGRQRINVIFKIDKQGNVAGIRARASHPELEGEAIDVVKRLPKMRPGKQMAQPVTVPYSLPIVFMVQGKPVKKGSFEDPFFKKNG